MHPEIPYGIGGTAVVVADDRYEESLRILEERFGEDAEDLAKLESAAMAAEGPQGPMRAPRPARRIGGG